MEEPDNAYIQHVLDTCVEYGTVVLTSQLQEVEARNFDLEPNVKKMAMDMYLIGVMWRYGEQFDLPTNARDRAFICFMYFLLTKGETESKAKQRIQVLNEFSRDEAGSDVLAIRTGYEFGENIGSLALLLEQIAKHPAAAGAPSRLIERSKPIAAILFVAGFAIAILIGRSFGEAFGVGFVAGVSVLAIARVIFHQMTKKTA